MLYYAMLCYAISQNACNKHAVHPDETPWLNALIEFPNWMLWYFETPNAISYHIISYHRMLATCMRSSQPKPWVDYQGLCLMNSPHPLYHLSNEHWRNFWPNHSRNCYGIDDRGIYFWHSIKTWKKLLWYGVTPPPLLSLLVITSYYQPLLLLLTITLCTIYWYHLVNTPCSLLIHLVMIGMCRCVKSCWILCWE